MISRIHTFLCVFILSFGYFLTTSAVVVYTPGAHISMTGANGVVYFDVADDIFDEATLVGGPELHTATRTFSGAFYLSGAGWVDFSTGAYRVELDCGAQPLSSLSSPCTLSGVAYSELIGDIEFDNTVIYHPSLGQLSGTASTLIGEYDFSGIALPLMPASLTVGNLVEADHTLLLTASGAGLYSGINPWIFHVRPTAGTPIAYVSPTPADLSHASFYQISIEDPDGGMTLFDSFRVKNTTPSTSLDTDISTTVRQSFCTSHPALCIDGATLRASTLSKSADPVVANGVDAYDFSLKLRDRYGNQIQDGKVSVSYTDTIRDIQTLTPFPYLPMSPALWMTLQTTGDLINTWDGTPTTGPLLAQLGDIDYQISSIAPTSATDILTLSGILYIDGAGVTTELSMPSWKTPLVYSPWYTTSLSAGPIVVGETVDFTTTYAHATIAPAPQTPRALYSLYIGDNSISSFIDFSSTSPVSCTKYASQIGVGECNWFDIPDPVVLSTESLSFSGKYNYGGYEPPPEAVTYRSYITYTYGGLRILYPASSGNLGIATPGDTPMKVLGQQNISKISGVDIENKTLIWNALRKNITLLSRNRTSYADTDYQIVTGDMTVSDMSFSSATPPKRTIISLGGDITLTSNLSGSTRPIALIALADTSGVGGSIHIDPSVTDIDASLFAEKSIFSTGAHQLYIHGSLISRNTTTDTKCPYYVSPCTDAPSYNLQNLRRDYLDTPGNPSYLLSGKHTSIPLVIEYDGRILTDPPPGLEK